MSDSLKNIRRDFSRNILAEGDVPRDPLDLLSVWLGEAIAGSIPDSNAMSLSTIDREGFPVSRIVLLRGTSKNGLCFFTNYLSSKGQELGVNPKAALQFFWPELERQIRIRGVVEKLSSAESDEYFSSRPRESQLGAWASPQSEVIASRDVLDANLALYTEKFKEMKVIPRPPHWGGYRLAPVSFEFWQGRPSRLHDRLRARLDGDLWCWQRLAP